MKLTKAIEKVRRLEADTCLTPELLARKYNRKDPERVRMHLLFAIENIRQAVLEEYGVWIRQ